jgi:hypothetical protein
MMSPSAKTETSAVVLVAAGMPCKRSALTAPVSTASQLEGKLTPGSDGSSICVPRGRPRQVPDDLHLQRCAVTQQTFF